jgi:hypothetical protein
VTRVIRKLAAPAVVVVALAGCASSNGGALQSIRDGSPATNGSAAEAGSRPQAAPKAAVAPAKLISSVPDSLAKATSARMDMTMSITGLGGQGDAPIEMTVEGVADFESLDMQMNMRMHGPAGLDDVEIEMRVVDGAMYMDIGSMADMFGGAGAAGLPANVKWLKIDAKELLDGMRDAGGQLPMASDAADPTKTFDMLRSVSDDVETLGREEVRGVETTHYRAIIDLKKAADSLPSDLKSLLPDLGVAPGGVPVEVWIDDQALLRRMDMRLDMGTLLSSIAGASGAAGAPGTPTGVITMRADMYDYGVDVHVEAPPADETYDMGSIFGAIGGATPGA